MVKQYNWRYACPWLININVLYIFCFEEYDFLPCIFMDKTIPEMHVLPLKDGVQWANALSTSPTLPLSPDHPSPGSPMTVVMKGKPNLYTR
jgi:hypothetical protein